MIAIFGNRWSRGPSVAVAYAAAEMEDDMGLSGREVFDAMAPSKRGQGLRSGFGDRFLFGAAGGLLQLPDMWGVVRVGMPELDWVGDL